MFHQLKMNILVACTGSVASIKVFEICEILVNLGNRVKLVPTKNALHFINVMELEKIGVVVHLDQEEWDSWKNRGDPVLHIEV